MSRGDRHYQHRGCAIGSEVTVTGTLAPILIETESSALAMHWKKMAVITLQSEPLDLSKLYFCIKRLEFWLQHLEITK